MKFLRQVLLVFLISFLGELVKVLLPWPIPASIYGMVLLFAALALRIIRLDQIRDAGSFFVSILPVLFVAPIVSLMDCWEVLKPRLVPVAVILLVSTVVCFAVSGWIPQWLMNRKKGGRA